MGRKKGDGKGRLGGRTKGTPNKVTGTVKEWIASIIDGNRKQFEEDLQNLNAGNAISLLALNSKESIFLLKRHFKTLLFGISISNL